MNDFFRNVFLKCIKYLVVMIIALVLLKNIEMKSTELPGPLFWRDGSYWIQIQLFVYASLFGVLIEWKKLYAFITNKVSPSFVINIKIIPPLLLLILCAIPITQVMYLHLYLIGFPIFRKLMGLYGYHATTYTLLAVLTGMLMVRYLYKGDTSARSTIQV